MWRDISREATKLAACTDLHEHGRTVGVEEDLEVALTEQSRSSSHLRRRRRRLGTAAARGPDARNQRADETSHRIQARVSSIGSPSLPALERIARGTIASGTSAVKQNNHNVISSGKWSK